MANESKQPQPSESASKAPAAPSSATFSTDAGVRQEVENVKKKTEDAVRRGGHAAFMNKVRQMGARHALAYLPHYGPINFSALAKALIDEGYADLAVMTLAAQPKEALAGINFASILDKIIRMGRRDAVIEGPALFGFVKEGQGGVQEVDFDALTAFIKDGGDDCGRELALIASLRKAADFETVEKLCEDEAYRAVSDMLVHLPRDGRKLSTKFCVNMSRTGFAESLFKNRDIIGDKDLNGAVSEMITCGKAGLVFQNREKLGAIADKGALLKLAIANDQALEAFGAYCADWGDDMEATAFGVALVRAGQLSPVFENLSRVFPSGCADELVMNLVVCGHADKFFRKPKDVENAYAEALPAPLSACVAQSLEKEKGLEFAMSCARYFDTEAKATLVLNAWAKREFDLVIKLRDRFGFSDGQWRNLSERAAKEGIDHGSLRGLIKSTAGAFPTKRRK